MFPNNNKDDILVIDNFIYSYALDLRNGIPIKPYYMGKDDNELKYIADKLQNIRNEPDSASAVDFIDKQLGLTEFYMHLAGGENSPGGRQVRKSLIGGPNKPHRASVIVGQPQSPPSPSHSPGRRLSTGANKTGKRNYRPSG